MCLRNSETLAQAPVSKLFYVIYIDHGFFFTVQGMCYIQSTDIKSHGDLKSPNCLVDSRWVLKIADYGLPTFKEKQRKTYPSEYAYYRGAYYFFCLFHSNFP